ncbi:MAG: methionyl aminopeptidase [Thermotogota bacterium]|nr:methionyl aminopeptidase [Thermotogota bacterium]MDK2864146.1 methionyl aminopeptidase [Thermotogota bacterium]HCZ06880.1 type I methionyl aminopeptidase [Thermotogota bacterium]
MIRIKSSDEIRKMEYACRVVAEALKYAEELVAVGATTYDIDRKLEEFLISRKVKPAFKGYSGYPATSCISLNEVVVHGIPSKKIVLKPGDLVSIDLGALYEGYYGDAARTYAVNGVSETALKLLKVTEEALRIGIDTAKPGARIGDVSHAIQKYVEENGFNVIRDYVGHGIGRELHEEPQIPNFGDPGTGPKLMVGMTLAIEPMVSAGDWRTVLEADGWTAVTADRSLAAHFEHTVVITPDGARVLTTCEGGN